MIMKHIIIVSLVVGVMTVKTSAADIQFLTHSSTGQTYVDKHRELRGKENAGKRAFHIELVREMMRHMNHPNNIKDYPLVRAIATVQEKDNIALFNLSRTPEREQTLKWVGPLQSERGYLYESTQNPTGITSIEDAKRVRLICVVKGGVHERALLKADFTNLYQNTTYKACFKMLHEGHVQLTASSSTALTEKLIKAEVPPDNIQQTPVIITQSVGFVAFSKNIPDKVIQQWQDALDAIKASGQFQQLYDQFMIIDEE